MPILRWRLRDAAGGRRAPLRLRTRLALTLLLAGVLPVAVHGYLSRRDAKDILRAEALDRAQQVSQLLAARTGLFLRGARQHLVTLAESPELRTAILRKDWRAIQRSLHAAARHHPELRAALVTDAGGRVRAATGVAVAFMGQDVTERPHIALARQRRELAVAGPFRAPADGRPIIAMGAPILDGHRVVAVIGASVDLSLLAAEIQRVRVSATGFAVVQAPDGRIIAHQDPSRIFQTAPHGTRASTLRRLGPTGALETTRPDGRRDFTGYAIVPDLDWMVLVHIPRDEALAGFDAMERRMVTVLAWLLAMVGLAALLWGRVLARPLNELSEAARALGAGDTSRRVPVRRDDEIGQMARAFNEMADRRQRAEAALQVSLARRNALARLCAGLAAETDRHRIMRQVVMATARVLDAPYAVLWTADPERGLLTAAAEEVAPALRPLPSQSPIPLGRGIASTIMGDGRPVSAPDVRNDPRWGNPAWPGLEALGAYAGVPLAHEGSLAGVLAAMDRPGRTFTHDEIEVLRTLGAHALLAIEKARLLEAHRQAADETRALYEAGQAITESLDLDLTLNRIAEAARRLAGADRSFVWLVDPRDASLSAAVAVGEGAGAFLGARMPADSPALAARAARARRALAAPDASDAALADPGLSERLGNGALLAAPLRVGEVTHGVLVCGYNGPRPFLEADLRRLERLAQQAAIAVENARLFGAERARRNELEAVRAVTAEVTRELGLPALLDLIDRRAADLVGAASGSVYLWDESQQLLVPKAWHGNGDWMAGIRFRLGEGVTGRVAERREGLIVNDYRAWPGAHRLLIEHGRVTAVLAEPLLYRDRLLGVITVNNPAGGKLFTEGDRQILALFAAQAAIAIENARLYQQVATHAQTLEERVRERTAELEKASRAKSEFLANMSHELRTPLNAIIGFADLLRMPELGPLSARQEKYLGNIATAGKHLLSLVNDILDLARVEAGRLKLRPERVEVRAALAEALEALRPQTAAKGLAIAQDVAAGLPPALADRVRLRQILVNLLSNAVKFTPDGGRVTVRAGRVEAGGTDWLEIAVEDTGIGIAPENLPRLFQKFEQLEGGLAKPHPGAGLGLALTRHLVQMHGGTIAVRSEGAGKGTTFTVRLPLAAPQARPRALVALGGAEERATWEACLEGWGVDATAAASVPEARAALAGTPPDLLILDPGLPGGSALDFAREVRRALAPGLPILLCARPGAGDERVAAAAGVNEIVEAGTPADRLRQKVHALLTGAGWAGITSDAGTAAAAEPAAKSG